MIYLHLIASLTATLFACLILRGSVLRLNELAELVQNQEVWNQASIEESEKYFSAFAIGVVALFAGGITLVSLVIDIVKSHL